MEYFFLFLMKTRVYCIVFLCYFLLKREFSSFGTIVSMSVKQNKRVYFRVFLYILFSKKEILSFGVIVLLSIEDETIIHSFSSCFITENSNF